MRPSAMLPLARLAAWTSGRWVRELDEWSGEAEDDDGPQREEATLRGLAAHLLETWEVPEALHAALSHIDGPPISEASHRVSIPC